MKIEKDLIKKRVGEFEMFLDSRDPGLSRALLRSPGNKKWAREADFMQLIEDEVQPGMTVVDIGGNIGYVTLVMADLVGENGTVYSIEPSPRNFEVLKRNVALNKYENRVRLHNMAVSNEEGVIDFYLSDKSNLHTLCRNDDITDAIQVSVTSLKKMFDGKKQPDFIKMDIEGAEVEAIDGMMDLFMTNNDPVKILLEVHPRFYSDNHSLEKQLRRLLAIGFQTKYVISAATRQPEFFKERGYEPFRVYNDGPWKRGVYKNITDEDMIASACHKIYQNVTYSRSFLLKRPWQFFSRHQVSDKIVRAIMLERAVKI